MKQVLLSGSGAIEVFEVPVPALMANSVLVRNAFSLISTGTEAASVSGKRGVAGLIQKAMESRHRLEQVWDLAKSNGIAATVEAVQRKLSDYVAIGYSCAGVVVDVGSAEVPFRKGDLVACMGGDFATHSEYVVVPTNLVSQVPASVSLAHAAFGALGSIAMHGIRRLELTPGETVGVLGLGLVGQLTAQLLAAMGFRPVGLDLLSARAEFARSITAMPAWGIADVDSPHIARQITGGHGLDGVVVCAATKSDEAINLAFDLCRKGGRVSVVGDVALGLSRSKMYQKEIELRVSCSYGPGRYDPSYEVAGRDYPLRHVRWTEKRNLEYFLELISAGKLHLEHLISATFPVGKADQAYAKVKNEAGSTLAVVISYGEGMLDRPSPSEYIVRNPGVTRADVATVARNRIRLGIIGSGKFVAGMHLPNLRRLSREFEVTAIASRSGSSATVLSKRHGIPVATSDPATILEDSSIDAVMVCTRHSSHARLVVDALTAGKHVFVEKPMCTGIEDGRHIVTLAREKRLVVRVGFNRRFSPYLRAMKQAIGRTGTRLFLCRVNIGSIENDWSNTEEEGGRVLGEGVHFFDLCNWFFESVPHALSSAVAGENKPTNPNIVSHIQYPQGLAQILYTAAGNPLVGKEYFEAHGNGCSAIVDDYQELRTTGSHASLNGLRKGEKGHFAALDEFAHAVLGRPYPMKGADAAAGLIATEMALSVYADVVRARTPQGET